MALRVLFRISIAVLFFVTDFIPRNFPSEFSCRLNTKNVICINSVGAEKTVLAYVVFMLNLFFISYILCELWYLIFNGCLNPDFTYDSEFCQKYLLRKRKVPLVLKEKSSILKKHTREQTEFHEPLLPIGLVKSEKLLSLDTIFANISIHPKESEKCIELGDLFRNDCRTILVLGKNGFGKSMLCTKLLRDWSNTELETQDFKFAFLFRFQHLNSNSMKEMSVKDFLGKAEHSIGNLSDEEVQYVLDNPSRILFIFDGLDEFDCREKCRQDETNYAGFNGANDKIPVSAIFVKLLQKKLLPGATVVTTTRPSAIDSVASFIQFDKVLEIVGFKEDVIEKYVKDGFSEATWELIQSNLNILELCKIPALCYIVCNLLKDCSFASDSRLTGVYKEILRIFILTHHTKFKSKPIEQNINLTLEGLWPRVKLNQLASLAKEGLENNRKVFTQKELDKHGIKNSDLIVCQPRDDDLPYGYNAQPKYQFTLPYLQEFLAATYIVNKAQKGSLSVPLENFIESKVEDENWHLVLQFIAGLVSIQPVHVDNQIWKYICKETVGKFRSLLQSSLTAPQDTSTKIRALSLMKCFHEIKEDQTRVVSGDFNIQQIDFSAISDPLRVSPVECAAIAYFLPRLEHPLKLLVLSNNVTISDNGILEFAKLFNDNQELVPRELNISNCKVGDKGLKGLMAAARKEHCQLKNLILKGNTGISENGIEDVCAALRDTNCTIEKLNLYGIKLSEQSARNICAVLQAETCRLSELSVNLDGEFALFVKVSSETTTTRRGGRSGSRPTEGGSTVEAQPSPSGTVEIAMMTDINPIAKKRPIFDALTNCESRTPLQVLGLNSNQITDDGLTLLCEIIKHPNCQLKQLHLNENLITDKGLMELAGSLTTYDVCKLEELRLESNDITCTDGREPDRRPLLCEAIEHRKFKLSRLILSNNTISDVNKELLRNAAQKRPTLNLQLE